MVELLEMAQLMYHNVVDEVDRQQCELVAEVEVALT